MRWKVVLPIITILLVLVTLAPLSPRAYAWGVLNYQTCRGYNPKTYRCDEPTSSFTINDEVWIHAEFDFTGIPTTVTFNSTSEWRDPSGNLVQHDTVVWSGGSKLQSNRNLRSPQTTFGKWTVSYVLDGGPTIGHNVRVFSCTFTIGPLPIDSLGYVEGATLEVPYTSIPINASWGTCKSSLWKDAVVIKTVPYWTNNPTSISPFLTEGFLLLEHDDNNLYACIDLPTKTSGLDAYLWLEFDTAHDGYPHSKYQIDDLSLGARVNFEGVRGISVEEFKYTGHWMSGVVFAAAIDYSPGISCDKSGYSYPELHSCRAYDQNTTKRNFMWTVSIPLQSLRVDPSNPKRMGLYFRATTSITYIPIPGGIKLSYRGVSYPTLDRPSGNVSYPKVPMADLVLLPQSTTTTTSLTTYTTTRIESATSTTSSATSSANKHVTVTTTKEVGPPITVWAATAAIVIVSLVAVAYLMLKARKLRLSANVRGGTSSTHPSLS
jgi:hypothetical protein